MVYIFIYADEELEIGSGERIAIQSFTPKEDSDVVMLGADGALEWQAEQEGFSVVLPARREADAQLPVVLEFEPTGCGSA